jgi:predicted molibdopterin-dependent oxidoreductase YjgC
MSLRRKFTPRVEDHPILGKAPAARKVWIEVDGKKVEALQGETIAAALLASGIKVLHYTPKYKQPRGVFCAIGRCTDCIMTVNGKPNVRTCVTPVAAGMKVETQRGLGKWGTGK